MAGFPPHRWRGSRGGYQPPDDAFLPGIPNFFDPGFAAPPMMMMPPPDPYGGFGMGGPPPPPFGPGGGDDFDGIGPGPPPGPPFDPFGGGFYGPWTGAGFPGGWGGGGGFWAGGHGGGGDADGDDGGDDDDDDEDLPKATYRSSGHVRRGIRMVHNPKQTRLHIFKKTDLLGSGWKDGTKKARKLGVGSFAIWEADPNWTVKQLMDYLGKGDDKWAVTELSEAGSGRWYKGSTFKYADERAKETLSKQGWTERRGRPNGQSPVWLAMHKAE